MLRTGILIVFGMLASCAFGQKDEDTIRNKQVVTVFIYKPTLIDAQKIESVPVLDKPMIASPTFTYNIKAKQVKTDKIVNPIPAADINPKTQDFFPSSFVKLGYGNLRTPLAELYFNNKQNSKYSYGVHYRFLQSNSDLHNSFADFTDHGIKGYLSSYTEAGEFGLDINYKNNKYNYYGYQDTNKAAEKNLARRISNFDANAYFNSTSISPKKIKHRTQFNYYNFQIGNANESQYALKSRLYGNIPDFNELNDGLLSAVLGFDYSNFVNDTFQTLNRIFVQFDPRFEFTYSGLRLSAGFNTMIYFEGSQKGQTYVNPVIRASYPLGQDLANIYVGLDGRYHKQSLRNIIQTNPFTSEYELMNMYENVRFYTGLNTKLGSSADALFEVNYSNVTNMPLYITRADSLNSFTILYKEVTLLKFTAAFNYSFSEKVRIGVLGNFYNYEVNGEIYPWQLPNVDGKLNMSFNIANKFYPHIDIIAMGLQRQRTGEDISTSTNSSIDAFYDISAGIDYRFKKKLSIFVQANNIASKRYQRWYNYPVYGFNIIGGFTMIF